MNLVSLVPYRIVPPTDGGKGLSYGSCKGFSKLMDSFSCIALTTLRRSPGCPPPVFKYQEIPCWGSILLAFERLGLFPNIPYLESMRFLVPRLARECIRREADVVEVSLPWLVPVREYLPQNVKVVMLAQNVEALWYEPAISSRLFPGYFRDRIRTLETRAMEFSDHVVTLTDNDREELIRRYGASALSVTTIPPGFDPEMFHPPKHEPAPQERVRAVYVGSRFSGNTAAVKTIIDSIAPQCDSCADFLIAGSVCATVDTRNAPGNVTFMGYVEDLPALFGSCDVLVNPSTMDTGINMKVLDAAACGLNVVSTPEGARGYDALLGEVVTSVPLAGFPEAIRGARRPSSESRRKVLDFSWNNISRRRLDLYASL